MKTKSKSETEEEKKTSIKIVRKKLIAKKTNSNPAHCASTKVASNNDKLPGSTISRRAAAWTLPAGFVPMHWNIPASEPMRPKILRLWLEVVLAAAEQERK